MASIGKPLNRIDGQLKVTGTALYAAEFNQPNMVYAFPVRSTIAKGIITSIDASAAKKSGGVLAVITYQNAMRLQPVDPEAIEKAGGSLGEDLAVLQDNKVEYFGQFIGVVVAETYEQARAAAALVKVNYTKQPVAVDLKASLNKTTMPEKSAQGEPAQVNVGKAAAPLAAAAQKIEATYSTSIENHHPMETHAVVAVWDGSDKLTLYSATQGVIRTKSTAAYFFNLPPDNVRVLCPYLGGGFGTKGSEWGHVTLAAMAAKTVSRPVKLVITRQMMQTNVGRRAATVQTVALGSDSAGKLSVMRHKITTYSNLTKFFEASMEFSKGMYSAPLREITTHLAKLTLGAPTYMRAPGYASGGFAIECAMDEMAYKLNIDPMAFRVLNHTAVHPLEKHPWSSENLLECYRTGAGAFGWDARELQPRQVRKGRQLIGYGMATSAYNAGRSSAAARIQMTRDGKVKVMSATHDLGTGTYTIMAQTAADALGIPVEQITVEIADSSLPAAPLSAGSQTTASVMPAVMAAGEQLRKDLLALAMADPKSAIKAGNADQIAFAGGKFYLKADASKSDTYSDIMRRNNKEMMEACVTVTPASGSGLGPKAPPCMPAEIRPEANRNEEAFAFQSFGAQFVEVWVDEDLGTIRVKRITSVQDVGRIMNEKTARSQVIGGVIYAMGQALMEETLFDPRWGNPAIRSFADYHVPVQLDVPPIDVHFINKPDPHISPIGARGLGEIGGVGIAAAIANAVFNATGKRVRDLPLTLDKLI